MGMVRIILRVATIGMLIHWAMATNYIVGAPNGGWDLRTPLQAWANSNTFFLGDSVTFIHTAEHDVVEVTKTNYDACQANNPIQAYAGGNTVISLPSSGNRYFICGTPGHCDLGMKVVISTASSSVPPPPTPSSTPSPSNLPFPSPTPRSSPSPSTSSVSPSTSPASNSPSRVSSPFVSPASNSPSTSPSNAPMNSPPKISPLASSPSTKSPIISPSKSPASSHFAPPPSVLVTESPAFPPFPSGSSSPSAQPSSAGKINVVKRFTMGLAFTIIMMIVFSL